jgi:hypothetical protein
MTPDTHKHTPLALLVREKLQNTGQRQSEFCRQHRFDQGLLSKVMNSVVTTISLESALRLAVGLNVPAEQILGLIERTDLDEFVQQAYKDRFITAPQQ